MLSLHFGFEIVTLTNIKLKFGHSMASKSAYDITMVPFLGIIKNFSNSRSLFRLELKHCDNN